MAKRITGVGPQKVSRSKKTAKRLEIKRTRLSLLAKKRSGKK